MTSLCLEQVAFLMPGVGGPYCWDKCQAMPGGVDGGGGPRKATAGPGVAAPPEFFLECRHTNMVNFV